MNIFHEIIHVTERELDEYAPQVKKKYGSILNSKHPGFGYYSWKPEIVETALRVFPESGVIYVDAGCELNLNPISLKRFNEYLNLLEKTSMLTMALHTSIFDNTSDEVLEFFAISKNQSKTTKMNQSGIIFMINNDKTKELLREWADTAINNPSLFRSSATKFEDSTEFRTGRHDQSILSCLMLKRGFQGIPDETYFGPDWNGKSFEYPIWALRNARLRSRIRSGDAD